MAISFLPYACAVRHKIKYKFVKTLFSPFVQRFRCTDGTEDTFESIPYKL